MTTPPKRTFFSHTIYSAHLEEERTIKIFLPDSGRPHSLLYCQDGMEFFMYGRIATLAKELAEQGQIDLPLIVGVGKNARFRSEEYMPGGERNQAFVRFFLEEAAPFVEREYSEYLPESGQTARHLAGVSLGAAASLQIALEEPASFRKLMLFSGAFYQQLAPLFKQLGTVSHLSAYVLVGDEETALETPHGTLNLIADHRWVQGQLAKIGVQCAPFIRPGNHTWGFWQREIPAALRWLSPPKRNCEY